MAWGFTDFHRAFKPRFFSEVLYGHEWLDHYSELVVRRDLWVFATIAEMAGIALPEINDSKSFKSLLSEPGAHRDFQYAEMDNGTDDRWTLSNGQYKLFVNANGDQEMYDLSQDPYENTNLLLAPINNSEAEAKTLLQNELDRIRN